MRRAIALARDTALAQLSSPVVLPNLEVVADRLQPKLNLPAFRPPEVEPEVIQLVAKGVHDRSAAASSWVQPTKAVNISMDGLA